MRSNHFSRLSRAVHKMTIGKPAVGQWYLTEAENCFVKHLFRLCRFCAQFLYEIFKKLECTNVSNICNCKVCIEETNRNKM
jgi:hypothetical protein